MNKATGFQALENVLFEYQPLADRGVVIAPSDPRTDGTRRLYSAAQWGRNAIFVNTDSRSYRDIRLKTADASADDTGPRADNPNRTFLGDTQLAWLKQTLLDAQNNGTTWKFVSVSDPIDQIGPIGGSLSGVTAATMQPFSGNINYAPVNADGGKSYIGGYRPNVTTCSNSSRRIRSPTWCSLRRTITKPNQRTLLFAWWQTGVQSSYVKVPYVFFHRVRPAGRHGTRSIS
jgi:hypothetical protein